MLCYKYLHFVVIAGLRDVDKSQQCFPGLLGVGVEPIDDLVHNDRGQLLASGLEGSKDSDREPEKLQQRQLVILE